MEIVKRLCQDVFNTETMTVLEIPTPVQTRVKRLFEMYTTRNWPTHQCFGLYYAQRLEEFLQKTNYEKLLRHKNVGWETIGAINMVLKHYGFQQFKPVAVLLLEIEKK